MTLKKFDTLNRELSWLSFNERVLQEAEDKNVPLVERIKFLGIFSSNRDEFFRVRVATVKRMIGAGKKGKAVLGEDPDILLGKIQKMVIAQANKFDHIYLEIIADLKKHGIHLVDETNLGDLQRKFVRQYFHDEVMPALVPIMLDSNRPFPFLKDKAIYFLIKLNREGKRSRHAVIEIPAEVLPRFVVLPSNDDQRYIILLDDVIRHCMDDVFAIFEHTTIDAYTIKLTRDAELDIDNDVNQSIVEKISKSVKKRKQGAPVRLTYDNDMPVEMLDFLMKKIGGIKTDNLIPGGRYHNFKDFMSFPNLGIKSFLYQPIYQLDHEAFHGAKSFLEVIKSKDVLLSYPYHSFRHVIDVLREASIDPKVESIKMTLYRAAKHSRVVNALINAMKNGKKVTVVVELQARFDEEANLHFASKLKEEGATVIYGVPGLKVHSKLFLISRRENRKVEHIAHIGTGNFNEQTARFYCDNALLTADRRITEEVARLFGFYENNLKRGLFQHLLVAPFYMRRKLVDFIAKEIKNAKEGKPASIFLKVNNLVDKEMIQRLYDAGEAGVQVRIIVRGICCLVPGESFSKNIEAVSIVDKFLEHSRVFIFSNAGNPKYFISSADWMARNLDFRSEVAVPIYDLNLQADIQKQMDLQWSDNQKTRLVDKRQINAYRTAENEAPIRAQDAIYSWIKEKKEAAIKTPVEA